MSGRVSELVRACVSLQRRLYVCLYECVQIDIDSRHHTLLPPNPPHTILTRNHTNILILGNVMLNATRAVLNRTRDFFLHGVLPDAGLDELDEFLLKKIGESTEK